MKPWQDEIRPSCNGFHETRMTDEGMSVLGEGLMRTSWTKPDFASKKSAAALTTLRWEAMEESGGFEKLLDRNNRESKILGRHSGVQCVLDIYASCGTSIVTELADRKNFYENMVDLTPLEKLSYSEHISSCLADIHGIDQEGNATIVHNDLHPGNVLFV